MIDKAIIDDMYHTNINLNASNRVIPSFVLSHVCLMRVSVGVLNLHIRNDNVRSWIWEHVRKEQAQIDIDI